MCGDGFRPLVLGCSSTHSHVCAERRGLSANYRLKSDREESEGKGTAGEGGGAKKDFDSPPPQNPQISSNLKSNNLGAPLGPPSRPQRREVRGQTQLDSP